jgi:ABC-type transporter Mla MlaB component
LKLEGSLAGAWVAELEEAWRASNSKLAGRVIRVDMTGVDRVDGNPFGITTFPWPRLPAYFEE